jgi:UDP-glucose 4-epimerase
MRILVTGGAGYIGSVITEQLVEEGHRVVVLDNLSKGHSASIPCGVDLIRCDLIQADLVEKALIHHGIEAVVHMAACSLVGESAKQPSRYYSNNLTATLSLLDSMKRAGVRKLVFSSTAAVYGEPDRQPIYEDDPTSPTNTYGDTKLAAERALYWYSSAYSFRYISLRYFNAAGATALCGELHEPETHLIPLILQVAIGRRESIPLYGTDYKTRDGTCIRDYVHVRDIGHAHLRALEALEGGNATYNVGCGGEGYSVKEVIECASRITGKDIPVEVLERRRGDPATLTASSSKIETELGWKPQFQSLEEIIGSAWAWNLSHPGGYSEESVHDEHAT